MAACPVPQQFLHSLLTCLVTYEDEETMGPEEKCSLPRAEIPSGDSWRELTGALNAVVLVGQRNCLDPSEIGRSWVPPFFIHLDKRKSRYCILWAYFGIIGAEWIGNVRGKLWKSFVCECSSAIEFLGVREGA